MTDYIPPKDIEIPFKFSDDGYAPPDFNSILSKDLPNSANISLKNIITGIEVFHESDSLKECITHSVGYSSGDIQVFKSGCVYIGIRDVSVYLKTVNLRNIPVYIKTCLTEAIDIATQLKGWDTEVIANINNVFKGWLIEKPVELPVYLKQGLRDQIDLTQYLKVFQFQQDHFIEIIKGWNTGAVKDLFNTVKSWYQEDFDISKYIKSTIQDTEDLSTIVYKIWQHNNKEVNLMLHGWQSANLNFLMQSLHIEDLLVMVRATYFGNISAFLYPILPVDIEASLMGWATQDLFINIAKGFYGGDLPIQVTGIASVNLPTYLNGKLGINVTKDLNCIMTNLAVGNLPTYLNTIAYSDLNTMLTSSRFTADLGFKIYPKIVFVRHNINVSFLEHRDLAASINHTCISSSFNDLSISMLSKHKFDLPSTVYGSDGSNIVDLGIFINSYDYIVQNTIPVKYINLSPKTYINANYKNTLIYNFNTIDVYSTDVFMKSTADLAYSITGDMLYSDLGVRVHPYSNPHYGTPITQKFIILKLKNNIEDFRKYAQLTFNSYVNKYYYFSGNQKAYRAFKNDHWVVRVEGYEALPVGSGFEKTKVSRKYIFNLNSYETIDAAIKDMIDRVTQLRDSDLGVSIVPTGGVYNDLNIQVMPNDMYGISARKRYYTNRILRGSILITIPMTVDLPSHITPNSLKWQNDLSFGIVGIDDFGSINESVNFNFEGSGDSIPPSDQVDFIFPLGED
jgi:hypothetical protein